jgi:hypothetical protein
MSVTDARDLATEAHADQRDRDGRLHIDHVMRVAESVPPTEAYQRVAWLHDVLEDSEIGVDELRRRLPEIEVDALLLLTHDRNEPYVTYIARIVHAPGDAGSLARAVKEADMLDNLRRCALGRDPAIG